MVSDKEKELQKGMERLQKIFPTRESHLGFQLVWLSMYGQPCDITFYERKPMLDVTIEPELAIALMYGAGAKKLAEMLSRIKVSYGKTVNMGEIWTINPMPKEGFTQEQLDAVNMAKGEEVSGPTAKRCAK